MGEVALKSKFIDEYQREAAISYVGLFYTSRAASSALTTVCAEIP
jgi:hypothetical protein